MSVREQGTYSPAHANARAELHRLGGRDSRVLEKLLTKPKLIPLLFQFIARSGRYRTVFGEIPVLLPLEMPTRSERIAQFNAIPFPAVRPRIPRDLGPDWVPPV
ncbi:hypothetical protein C8R44DRAFT_887239 [Mycena epipterygia]|nr:hypothetical protein C8R44DRAFT_887239 [Mycena epipterygia]